MFAIHIKDFDPKRLKIIMTKTKDDLSSEFDIKLKYIYDNGYVDDLALNIGEIGPLNMVHTYEDKIQLFYKDDNNDLYRRLRHVLLCAIKIVTSDKDIVDNFKKINKHNILSDWKEFIFDEYLKDNNAHKRYENSENINSDIMTFDIMVNGNYNTKFIINDKIVDTQKFIEYYSKNLMNLIPVLKFNNLLLSTDFLINKKIYIPLATVTILD